MKKLLLFLISFCCGVAIAQAPPTLIPYPNRLEWGNGQFILGRNTSIYFNDSKIEREIRQLQTYLEGIGVSSEIKKEKGTKGIMIHLDSVQKGESYSLNITPHGITLTAGTPHGVFNGIQTLKQLINGKNAIDACQITDEPAFAMRGYMIDVGRNYQSLPLIKEQIDVMARYKLNVLHFHATENVAWRFESKKYPQLHAAENMLRDKGKYYTQADLDEIIAYCNDRHILFLPEIDVPGHSAAFVRAMKTDMQSEQGTVYVKELIAEFIDAYHPKILHIGSDEVKIVNQQFLPEIINFIERKGVKVMGWSPGGNITDSTIRQLWMEESSHKGNDSRTFVDSRHLYLNHFDPLEGVNTVFHREIGNRQRGDRRMLGAILCNWPDRKVEYEDDVLTKSATYPTILAFAERTWRGGGTKGWVANVGSPDDKRTQSFIEFENRLLAHKDFYFKDKKFPYVKQQNMVWNLYGPYDNEGDLDRSFAPEQETYHLTPYRQIVGGTVVLRHWWHPLIEGALMSGGKENSTWYATTEIWSDTDKIGDFWIGFYNISRSQSTDTAPDKAWDFKQSKVWVNGNEIAAPSWTRSGQEGGLEIPLTDEGYEYRTPTKIPLKKGWNKVLIKAPVGKFKGKNWNNPVKWMFTFVPVE